MKRFLLTALTLIATTITVQAFDGDVSQGTLRAADKDGNVRNVPLKHTSVKADISGYITRVDVKQEFVNDFGTAIEAVYVFPLSHDGAVDRMTMLIGSRRVNGVIMRREEAQKTYETAKNAGQTAALLDQERPNIFTQRVANILPGETIVIEISYVETLKYESGAYEFVFPMVVAPRYNPGSPTGYSGTGRSRDTNRVRDASGITPQIAKERAGHDVSIEVNLHAGVPVVGIKSELHEIDTEDFGGGNAKVGLKQAAVIPNKDFILRYKVAGQRIEDAVLSHRGKTGGFFTMILQPPDDMTVEDLTPKEIVFVLDTSGSMSGFPIEKAKEAMRLSIEGLHPRDTFNIITFAGSTEILFDRPVPATRANLDAAKSFLENTAGFGGTEMMKAIKAALDPTDSQEHLRIVCFMTDGLIGNEDAIIGEIQNHKNARVFSFGIGNSVNRHLLENMAREGNGEAEIVTLESESKAASERFYKRVRTPLLTDISIDWNGLPVDEIYPSKIPDLFTAKPVVINGRFRGAGKGKITLKGKIAGQHYERDIDIDLPEAREDNDVLATLWARRKIAELTNESLRQDDENKAESEEQITNIGLEFKILTQFTSFVAVEERAVNPDGSPKQVVAPVENPDGMKREDEAEEVYKNWKSNSVGYILTPAQQLGLTNTTSRTGSGGGFGPGGGGGGGGGGRARTVSGGTGGGGGGGNLANTVNTGSSSISVDVTRETIDSLPSGTRFSSLLKLSPNVSPEALGGGFQIDGNSGNVNAFVIDGQEIAALKLRSGLKGGKDDLTTSVAELKKPLIPAKAKWNEKDALVKVEFSVDLEGNVVKAKAVSGDKDLKKPSETAALGSKFTPPEFEGEKLKMNGMLSYKFVDQENVEITLESMQVELSPETKRRLTKKYKLHYWIYAVVERIEKGIAEPSENEDRFVKDGVADIRVMLNEGVADAEPTLRKAGLQIYKSNGSFVYGRISIDKLYDLAELDIVQYVTP